MRYCLRVKYNPKAEQRLADVRLTGWKPKGSRIWTPFGASLPGELSELLNPKHTKSGWSIRAKEIGSDLRSQLVNGMIHGSIATTFDLQSKEPNPGLSPYRIKVTTPTRLRCQRAFDKYSECKKPAMLTPPEPRDYFEQVVVHDRSWGIFRQVGGQWSWYSIYRTGHSGMPWRVVVAQKKSGYTAGIADWVNVGDPVQTADRWIRTRERVSWAWESNRTSLGYCLHCLEGMSDPLDQFPRFGHGQITSMTMEFCLGRASRCAKALWHMHNRTDDSWWHL